MRKIIIIVVMIVVIIFAGINLYVTKGRKIEVVKQSNGVNVKQTIDAVTKEINLESIN